MLPHLYPSCSRSIAVALLQWSTFTCRRLKRYGDLSSYAVFYYITTFYLPGFMLHVAFFIPLSFPTPLAPRDGEKMGMVVFMLDGKVCASVCEYLEEVSRQLSCQKTCARSDVV